MADSAKFSEERWWDSKTVAIVTGSNQGIGHGAATSLASQGLSTVVTSRSETAAKEAADKIVKGNPSATLMSHELDISDRESIKQFASWAKESFPDGIMILINNAGFAYKGNTFGGDEAEKTMAINYHGTANITEALLPLIKSGGRIVHMCSSAGKLDILPRGSPVKDRLVNATSRADIDAVAADFVAAIRRGSHKEEGFPSSMYGMSKLCEAMHARRLAKDLQNANITVNACHPGYVNTSMTSGRGHKTWEEGADTSVWLALRPPKRVVSGCFFTDRRQEDF